MQLKIGKERFHLISYPIPPRTEPHFWQAEAWWGEEALRCPMCDWKASLSLDGREAALGLIDATCLIESGRAKR